MSGLRHNITPFREISGTFKSLERQQDSTPTCRGTLCQYEDIVGDLIVSEFYY